MADFDLIVIGSGPGGYVSAIRASQLGLKTAIVERESLGGICLNWGCIPTKALLRSAEVLHLAKHASAYGLKVDKADFDLAGVVKRSRGVAAQLSGGVKHLMKKNKITVIEGDARLEKGTDAPKVIVKGKDGKESSYQAKHVLLATGARARAIPQARLEPDGKLIWTYREAMVPDALPKRLLVIDLQEPDEDAEPEVDEDGNEYQPIKRAPRVFVNPVITPETEEMNTFQEGCLSVPEVFADVDRPASCTVEYQDLDGNHHKEHMTGMWATVIQHEMDHLEGIVFIDHLSRLKRNMMLKKLKKIRAAA